MRIRVLLGTVCALLLTVFVSPKSVEAGFAVRITDTAIGGSATNPLIGTDGDGDGVITLSGTIAGSVWNITITTATSKPLVGSSAQPILTANVTVASTAAGALKIEVTDTDFGPSPANPLPATLQLNSSFGGTQTVGMEGYTDIGNAMYATTDDFSGGLLSISGAGNDLKNGVAGVDSNYSVTMVLNVTHTIGGTSIFDASLMAVPEPSSISLALMGMGLLGVGCVRRKKNSQTAA